MEFEFKITTWERIVVPEEHEKEALELIESGEINNGNELIEKFPDAYSERLFDVENQMDIKDNEGWATVEVKEGREVLYANGKF